MPPEVTPSDTLTLDSIRAIVLGPPDRSKSVSSLTLSEKCPAYLTHVRPKVMPKREPLVTLDDILYLTTDKGATDGFKQLGVSVPQIDISSVDLKDMLRTLREATDLIRERIQKRLTKALVLDTITSLDEKIVHYNQGIRGLEKYDLWRAVLTDHRNVTLPLQALKCHIIFLCHAKALTTPGDGEASTAQRQARTAAGTGMENQAVIIPDISGKALNHYRANASFILPIIAKNVPEGVEYTFRTKHPEFETKARVGLPEVVAADWRVVRKLLA